MNVPPNIRALKLDPRTQLLLLILSNVVTFTQHSIWIETAWVVSLLLLIIACGCIKSAIKLSTVFAVCLLLQYCVFPNVPKIISSCFAIFVSYARKLFPCLIVGSLIIKKTSAKELIAALRKCRIPQKLLIPLSVTIRYFPAIKEETGYIKDAMKLRNIHGIRKIECMLVPIMISAAATAEELSAAAVTRGIENPVRKTSMIDVRFGTQDFACLILGVVFCIISFAFG